MEMLVLGWLVLELTNSPALVGLVAFCRAIPVLFVGGFGGMLADRIGRRPLIIAAQTVTFTMYGAMALLLATGFAALWQLVVISLILGCAWAMDWPTRRALIPDLVGRARTLDALLLESLGMGIARTLGPFAARLCTQCLRRAGLLPDPQRAVGNVAAAPARPLASDDSPDLLSFQRHAVGTGTGQRTLCSPKPAHSGCHPDHDDHEHAGLPLHELPARFRPRYPAPGPGRSWLPRRGSRVRKLLRALSRRSRAAPGRSGTGIPCRYACAQHRASGLRLQF